MSSLEDILVSAQSANQEIRVNATNFLSQQLHTDPSHFLLTLCKYLSDPLAKVTSRQLAGYYIKNTIINATNDPRLNNIWNFVVAEVRQEIKNLALGTLADNSREIRQISAQIISCIGQYEIPQGMWPEVLPVLITNGTNINPVFKEAALMALGYICEVIPDSALQKDQADKILTVLAAGLSSEEKDLNITKTSLSAFRNSLKFIRSNIESEVERKIILDVLIQLCAHPSNEVRRESLSILCDIGYVYYDYIESDLMALGNVTYNAIRNDEISVALVGMEFWNLIGDIEVDREEVKSGHRGYIQTASVTLTGILLEKIQIFDENSDDSEWNMHKACGSVLGNIALLIRDQVVNLIIPYISENLNSANWKLRRSAALVFGSILQGPTVSSLSHLVISSISLLINLSADENYLVRQTIAWCISRILAFYTDIVHTSAFKEIISAMKSILSDLPLIATYMCAGVHYLTNYEEFSKLSRAEVESLYNTLLGICLGTSELSFKITAFSALASIIEKVPVEFIPMVENKLELFIDILQRADRDMQVVLCSLLHCIFGRATPGAISEEIADRFMIIVIQMFSSRHCVLEEAIEAVGILAENLQAKFEKYLNNLIPILIWGLEETVSSTICKVSVMCVGDLTRALNLKFMPYIMHFVPKFLNILGSESMDLAIKIECIGSLGDLSSIPGAYLKYMSNCLVYIDSAAGLCMKPVIEEENPDLFDGINSLRESVLCFYVSLVNGLNEGRCIHALIGHVEKLIEFCLMVTQDYLNSPTEVHVHAIGLLGDIATNFREAAKYAIKTPPVMQYLQKQLQSTKANVKEAAFYSYQQILKL